MRRPLRGYGYVYIMINAAWPDWVKIGKTQEPEQRLLSFNAGSPLKDYAMPHVFSCKSPLSVEAKAIDSLKLRGLQAN